MMDLNNFDKQLKSSLENLEAPFDGASWSALESKLNASFSEEQPAPVEPVDLTVKRVLDRMELGFQPAHWQLLNAKLDRLLLARRVRQTKIAEVAIFLLLLINIEGFLGGIGEVVKPKAPAQPAATVPMAAAEKPGHSTKKRLKKTEASNDASIATGFAQELVNFIASALGGQATEMPVSDPVAMSSTAGEGSFLDSKQFYNQSGITKFQAADQLPQVPNRPMAWNSRIPNPTTYPTKVHRAGSGFYLGSFAAFDQNTAFAGDYTAKQNGYGGGLKVGYRKGKWGVETGLAYQNIQYQPKKEVEIYAGNPVDGFTGSFTNQVDADMLTIPVKVTRRLAKARHTSLHATAGLTASVATQKRFNKQSVYFPPSSQTGGNQPDPGLNPIPGKRNDGVFEGGALSGNAFVSADLGLRIERTMGKRYTAFVEPAYRHALGKGFGPKREKINSFSLQAGVLAAL